MKLSYFLPVIIAIVATLPSQTFAKDAPTRAASEYELSVAVAKASRTWRNAFNRGDAEATAALYEKNAVMVAKPFGTFRGREAIKAFWADIIGKGFGDVIYYNTMTKILDQDLRSARISASWKMNNAHGVITNELWVLQPDGRALLREDYFEVKH